MFDLKKRALNCMDQAWVPSLVQVFCGIMHSLWCYIFTIKGDWGILGLGISMTITNFSMLLLVEVYSLRCIASIRESIFLPDKTSIEGWGEYLKLGVPAMLMIWCEWMAFEVMIIMSGWIGDKHQAALLLVYNIAACIHTVNQGIQSASAVVVGNSIGS